MVAKDFIIITGPSGAGKSAAIKNLEELNFFCVDNLPPVLLPKFAQLYAASEFERVAVAVDDSSRSFKQELVEAMSSLPEFNFKPIIIYLDAPNDILVRRFSASYRKHPLTGGGRRMLDAIRKERLKLEEVRGIADIIIDTGDITLHHLKEEITKLFFHSEDGSPPITVTILSFGYKFGIPRDADLVFDARILPNPFYESRLQVKDGLDEEVQRFVFSDEIGENFMKKIFEITEFMIPHYISRGKFHLTIGVGCTGGRHRSVVVASKLAEFLESKNYRVFKENRDLERSEP